MPVSKRSWDRIRSFNNRTDRTMSDQHIKANSLSNNVLEPIAETEFFTKYWEKQPLHISRSTTNPFEQLISVSKIEDLLSTNELFYPSVQLTQAGQSIPVAEYTDENNKIIGGRVVERYRRGSTIVLTHFHKLQKELMDLCRSVQSSFMMRCQTNVYLSPAGNQGFNPHFDTHDVFILQVTGSKTFNFYSGGCSFPTSADSFNSEIHKVGSKTESIALSAGDTLYIPRGFTHDAVACTEEPSLHVTLGVYPILMYELLQEMVHISIGSDVDVRKSIPQAQWMSEEPITPTMEQLSTIMQKHINEDVMSLALSRLRDSVALEATRDCRNSIQGMGNQSLTLSSVAHVNHKSILQLERSGSALKLRTFGALVEFNDPFVSSVEWLVSQSKCLVEDIPGLDNDQRTALVEKLLVYDLITLY